MEIKLGRKKIGDFREGTLYKEVVGSRHRFRKFDAWGIDSKLLHRLPEDAKIQITDIETGKIYKSTRKDYLDNQKYYHFKLVTEDYQTQLFLPLSLHTIDEPVPLTKEQEEENAYRMASGLSPRY